MLETLDYTIRIGSIPTFINICAPPSVFDSILRRSVISNFLNIGFHNKQETFIRHIILSERPKTRLELS